MRAVQPAVTEASCRVWFGKPILPIPRSMDYHCRMRLIVAILLVLGFAAPLAAQPQQNPLGYVQAGQWTEARAAAAQSSDPVAVKVIDYLRMLTPNAAHASEIDTFMRQNPDWPLFGLMARRRHEAMATETDDAALGVLCTESDPEPTPAVTHGFSPPPLMPARGAALLRCAEALSDLGRTNEAASIARDAWVSAISDQATEAAFIRRFPNLISAADQWARFQRLAWDDAAGAQRQIANLDPAHAALAQTRLGMKSNIPGPTARPDEDPGAMLDLARAYRKLAQDQAAVALWRSAGAAAQKAAPDHLPAFWIERQYLAHQLLRDGDAQDAYDLVAAHGQTEPEMVAEAEFLAGFVALRRLGNPAAAVRHFNALAATSRAVLTQSRASYWLGRAQTAMGRNPIEDYLAAATWPTTFYGQIAHRAAGQPDTALVDKLRVAPTPTPGLESTPATLELARAAVQLISWGDTRHARPFLLRMDELAHTPAARVGVANYAAALALPDVTVIVVRRLGRDGVMPPLQGWPVAVDPPPVPEPAVSLAIMRQESNFDIGSISPSGARGLMQLMPGTARLVAHRLGEPTSNELLTTDPEHNMRVGTAYLQQVLEQFGDFVPLAAAAYNAGPNRVNEWLAENGDPRVANQSMIDWIELIPFNETRNYVQRVLENVVVYQARLYGTLPPTMAQWSR
jgi:soluble lytic murein transglycosylase